MIILSLVSGLPGCGSHGGGTAWAEERSSVLVEDRVRHGYLEDETVCGFWTERLLSALYHYIAGRPDEDRVAGIPGVERIAITTKDRRQLGGYKLRAYADSSRSALGYVLVALGNAMLAD